MDSSRFSTNKKWLEKLRKKIKKIGHAHTHVHVRTWIPPPMRMMVFFWKGGGEKCEDVEME